MTVADPMLFAASAGTALGSAVLRYAWSLPRRSRSWNGIGWGLFALGALLGAVSAGAWGVAVAALFGMGTALIFLAHAAATARATTEARASNRRAGALPEGSEPWRIGRRIVTFLIVMLVAMIVSIGLAVAIRSLFAWGGAGEANANVAGLFAMPVAWALLVFVLLMEEDRAQQWRLLAMFAVPGALAAIVGAAA